jgi:hypothetical protein
MITDIFARRYASQKIWAHLTECESRLLVQGFRMLAERICPYYIDGRESATGKEYWTDLQSRLSLELGLTSLSPLAYSYPSTYNGKTFTNSGAWTMLKVCENWYMSPLTNDDANRYIQERLSLVEIGFRQREDKIKEENANLERRIAENQKPNIFSDVSGRMRSANRQTNADFEAAVDDLNQRFRQAECPLHYHNGFIQIASDRLLNEQVEAPFWQIVSDAKWVNVDTDMKEAIDRRDAQGRDPALYAARALESAIKIISGDKGWTNGAEKGPHNFIDNLASKRAGYISDWEADFLKAYFTKIRNPLGHGPGDKPMPMLTVEQTNFAIETAMVWIKSLISRSRL